MLMLAHTTRKNGESDRMGAGAVKHVPPELTSLMADVFCHVTEDRRISTAHVGVISRLSPGWNEQGGRFSRMVDANCERARKIGGTTNSRSGDIVRHQRIADNDVD